MCNSNAYFFATTMKPFERNRANGEEGIRSLRDGLMKKMSCNCRPATRIRWRISGIENRCSRSLDMPRYSSKILSPTSKPGAKIPLKYELTSQGA